MTHHSTTLDTGVPNHLQQRMDEHRHHLVAGFTSMSHMTRLGSFEETSDVSAALAREKQIKGWMRTKKLALIESIHPDGRGLREAWQGG